MGESVGGAEGGDIPEEFGEEYRERFRFEDQSYLLTLFADRGRLRTDQPREVLQQSVWLAAAPELVIESLDAGWHLERHTEGLSRVLKALLLD